MKFKHTLSTILECNKAKKVGNAAHLLEVQNGLKKA